MTDILEYALAQRDELYEEIDRLDRFIRTAKTLTERSMPATRTAAAPEPMEDSEDEEAAATDSRCRGTADAAALGRPAVLGNAGRPRR